MRRGPRYAAASAIILLSAAALGGRSFAEPAPAFAVLVRQAEATAPRLAEALAGVRQAEGLAQQAGARPNPTLSLDLENFSGSGPLKGFNQAETTLSIEQPFELGDKRGARLSTGQAGITAAKARLRRAEADYAFDLAMAYAEAEAAEREVALAEEAVTLAEEDLRVARALVEAGKEAELRSYQAEAAVSAARAALDTARADRTAAFARLTALAGSPTPFTSLAEGLLDRTPTAGPPALFDVSTSPAVLAAQAERDETARRVRLEQTRALPDLTASLGFRRFSGDDSSALVAGVSLPLPLFDRNRGNVAAVQGELAAADARLNAARLDAEADMRSAAFQVEAARSRVIAARQGETTAAEAYRLTRIAYESGKAPLSELTAARRSLTEARAQTTAAQLARVRAEAGLARLQGRIPFGDL
jgi:cobalt-zinc-cadmium efflux system outer membrane protein